MSEELYEVENLKTGEKQVLPLSKALELCYLNGKEPYFDIWNSIPNLDMKMTRLADLSPAAEVLFKDPLELAIKPKVTNLPAWQPWSQPELERPDRRNFVENELVKVHLDNRPKNDDNELEYNYYRVYDDGRGKKHRTYTYCLWRVHPPAISNEEGTRVYGYYPKDVEPCTKAEQVLYGAEITDKNYRKAIRALDHIKVDVTVGKVEDGEI